VTLACACEIHLQTLLYLEQKPARGHMLDRLSAALSPDVRSMISDRYTANLSAGTGPLYEALGEINHAYADWRALEKAGRSTAALNALWHLARTLAAVTVERCPDLGSVADDLERLTIARPYLAG